MNIVKQECYRDRHRRYQWLPAINIRLARASDKPESELAMQSYAGS